MMVIVNYLLFISIFTEYRQSVKRKIGLSQRARRTQSFNLSLRSLWA